MLLDRRESSQNPPTTVVSIALGSRDVQGNNFHLTSEVNLGRDCEYVFHCCKVFIIYAIYTCLMAVFIVQSILRLTELSDIQNQKY